MLISALNVWDAKLPRNQERTRYYELEKRVKNLGISVPPSLNRMEMTIGWPAKAVDQLANRSRFDGFVMNGSDSAMTDIVDMYALRSNYRQAMTSELAHSFAILTLSSGGKGEPNQIINAYSAEDCGVVWNSRENREAYAAVIIDYERDSEGNATGEPSWVNLYTDSATWEIAGGKNGWYVVSEHPHKLGRPKFVSLRFKPTLRKPLGQSRITRSVMSTTDEAIRQAVREAVAAEFITIPQKWIMGADDDTFSDNSKWDAYIGSILALTTNEDGEKPTVGQFQQGSMQPLTDYMRELAARFSGETSVPLNSMGIVHDNPASAEAIYAAKEDLVTLAEDLNEDNGIALRQIGLMAIASSQNKRLDELTDEELTLRAHFKNPAMPNLVSQADAVVKIVGAIPWVAETRIPLEQLGFDEADIDRMYAEKRTVQALQSVNAVLAGMRNEPLGESASGYSETDDAA